MRTFPKIETPSGFKPLQDWMQGSKLHRPWWRAVYHLYSPFSWSCSNRAVPLCCALCGNKEQLRICPFRLSCWLSLCFLRVKCLSIEQFPIFDHFCCPCHFLNLMLAGLLVGADRCKFSRKGKTWCYSLQFLDLIWCWLWHRLFVSQQGEVRLRCLLALQGLYGSPETALQMELFTGRFKVSSQNVSH